MNLWPNWWKTDNLINDSVIPAPLGQVKFARPLTTGLRLLDADLK